MRNVRLAGIALALISGIVAAGCGMDQSKSSAAAPGRQAQDTGGISVLVVDPTGAVISNATVQPQKEHGEPVANDVTNQAGVATFAHLPDGSYLMEVSANGFKTERQSVGTEAGNMMHLEIRLAVGQCSPCVEVEPGANFVEIDHSTETEVLPIACVQLISLPRQSNLFKRFLGKMWHGLGF